LVQLFILPILFPSAHWGDGLMVGGDWIQFHKEGIEIAEKVKEHGWSAWSLTHPVSGQAMSGIAGLFYALTGIKKPWVLLFYNAFLHATAGLILFYLLILLEIPKKLAVIISIPFVVFPTSFTWVTQIHKDGLYILGMYSTFLAFALAFSKNIKHNILGLLSGILGVSLFYLVRREYAFTIIHYFYLLFIFLTFVLIMIRLIQRKKEELKLTLRSMVILSLVVIFINFIKSTQTQEEHQVQQIQQTQWWYWDPYISDKIEAMFYNLAVWRNEIWSKYLAGHKGAIDEDVKFRSVMDFIEYTPRALQVGFFSPFPNFWFTEGSTTGGTIARYITPFEAIYFYIAWLLLPFAVWMHRKKIWFWFILLVCLGFIWLHVVAEPNVGPIVRKRYGYVMLLSAISYSTVISWYVRKKAWEK